MFRLAVSVDQGRLVAAGPAGDRSVLADALEAQDLTGKDKGVAGLQGAHHQGLRARQRLQ